MIESILDLEEKVKEKILFWLTTSSLSAFETSLSVYWPLEIVVKGALNMS